MEPPVELPAAAQQVFHISELNLLICTHLTDFSDIESFLLFLLIANDGDTGAGGGGSTARSDVYERCAGVITSGRKTWQSLLLRRLKTTWNAQFKCWSGSMLRFCQLLRAQYWHSGNFPTSTSLEQDLRRMVKPMLELHLKCEQRIQFIRGLVSPELDDLDMMEQLQTKKKAYCSLSVDINRRRGDRELQDRNLSLCIHICQSECLFQTPSGQPVFVIMGDFVTALQLKIKCQEPPTDGSGGGGCRPHAKCTVCDTGPAEQPRLGFNIRQGHRQGVFVDLTSDMVQKTGETGDNVTV